MHPNGFRFGDFVLDLDGYALRRGDVATRLQPKTFDVLRYLVENPGRLVTKQELLDAVWPGVIVTENSLTRCIKDVRRALDDDVDAPRYVETLPRKGYRFLLTPVPLGPAGQGTPAEIASRAGVDGAPPVPGTHDDAAPTPASAPALAPAAGSASMPAPASAAPRRDWRRAWIATALVLALAALAGLLHVQPWRLPDAPAAIAVLPFDSLSSDPEARWFADGVAEDVLDLLAKNAGLRVAARTSSFTYRDPSVGTERIASELGVRWLLKGSVRRDAQTVRVGVQLIDADSGLQTWSARYDRPVGEVFRAQDEIAAAVIAQVAPRLAGDTPPGDVGTTDLQAYEAYLLGRDYLNRRPIGWWEKSVAAYRQAVARDPQYARAHAGLALALAVRAPSLRAAGDAVDEAGSAAKRALELDPQLGTAYAALGVLALNDRPADAEPLLRRAIVLDPQLSSARSWLAAALDAQGRHEEARRELELALQRDPLNPLLIENYGGALQLAGQYDEARRSYERLQKLPQPPASAYVRMSNLELTRGNLTEALRWSLDWERRAPAEQGDARRLIPLVPYTRLGYVDEYERRIAIVREQPLAPGWLGEAERAARGLGRGGELRQQTERLLAASGGRAGPLVVWLAGRIAILDGDLEAGIERLAPLFPLDGGADATLLAPPLGALLKADTWMLLAWALRESGRTAEADAHLARIDALLAGEQQAGRASMPDLQYVIAMLAAMRGRTDEAVQRLAAAVKAGFNDATFARADPRWGELIRDPRVVAVLAEADRSVAAHRQAVDAAIARGDPAFVSVNGPRRD
jgi:TolB-like protein/DNA-binding winged helix-turn-helix (wHTH) protein/Flp pilus assembly protein TadD